MNLTSPLRIGTRGSPLALTQAEMVRNTLLGSRIDSQIQVVRTSGDMIVDRPLADLGGKGLFTKELDDALLSGSVDIAVHSMKDVPTLLPPGVEIVAMLPRADARVALLTTSI